MKHEALLGRKVADRFTIQRYLGEGGMATVFVAEQDEEPRTVALKIMNEELTADRSFVRRFQREAQAASRVQHPNSVQIIAYGVEGRLSYIAMELLAGDDLYVLLEREGAIGQARAARILIEVCEVLAVAHDLGIVHRDLKPENIMILADSRRPGGEQVKVLDFGIAKLIASDAIAEERSSDPEAFDQVSAVTRAGTFLGTPAYMSPEQCGLLPVDTRADIYTCGVLLFQLVTGRLPFEGQTPLHTATLHIREPAPRPSSVAPGIDPQLEAIIQKTLSKKPVDRYPTARHLGAALSKLLPELPDAPATAGPVTRRPQPAWRSVPPPALSGRSSAPADPLTAPLPTTRFQGEREDPASNALSTLPSMDERETPIPETPTRVRQAAIVRKPQGPAASKPSSSEQELTEDSSRTLIRPSLPEAQLNFSDETTQRLGPQPILEADARREVLPTLKSMSQNLSAIAPSPIESASGSINIVFDLELDVSEALRNELSEAPPSGDAPAPAPPPAPSSVRPEKTAPSKRQVTPLPHAAIRTSPVPPLPTGSAAPPERATSQPSLNLTSSQNGPASGPWVNSSGMYSPAPPSSSPMKGMTASQRALSASNLGTPGFFTAFFGATLLSSLLLVSYYFLLLFRR